MLNDTQQMILSGLNQEQYQAVLHTEGPALILAGAGSGKTSVLTRRIAMLLSNGATPESILALTFTNKAAKEMHERVLKMVGEEVGKSLKLTTFHAFGAAFLRKIHDVFGRTSNFVIYDDDDQIKAMREAFTRLNMPYNKDVARAIQGLILDSKDLGLDPCVQVVGEIEAGGNKYFANLITLEYESVLKSSDAFDFGDLILCPLLALQKIPDLLDAMRQRFKWVLVDEFQDTNVCQLEFVRLLCPMQSNIFVVGDDDQSIYSWRGAQVRNMLDFDKYYPSVKIFKLEQNYRSYGKILDASNEVISKNEHRHSKSLWTDKENGDNIILHRAYSETDEANYVLREIKRLRAKGVEYKDIAVLYRNNSLSSIIEETLIHDSIPYKVLKGFNFFERSEIKDVIAYIRILVNPNDEIAFRRAVATPSRGVGDVAIKTILEERKSTNVHIFDAIKSCMDKGLFKGKAKNALADFYACFTDSDMWIAPTLSEQLNILLSKSGYKDYLSSLEKEEDTDREQNVNQLLISIENYQQQHPEANWTGYLEDVKLVYEDPNSSEKNKDDDEASTDSVNLSTIHGVKGLEFTAVFIIGSDEEVFFSRAKSAAEIEEERRLFYVALTRAKRYLYVTHVSKRSIFGVYAKMNLCRFVEEIPCNTLVVDY